MSLHEDFDDPETGERLIRRKKPAEGSESTLNDLLCEPWPLKDVLNKLVEAANILLIDHDYDGHGREQINAARDKALEIIKRI